MKKLTFLVLFLLFTSIIYSQRRGTEIKWLSLAVKGGFGNSILINSNAMSDQAITMNFLSPAYSFGGRFGLTYGDNFGLNFEVLSSGFSQKYDINDPANPYSKNQKFTSLDYLILFRYTSDYGFYFEVGPKFSTMKSATIENPDNFTFTDEDNYIENFKEKYNSLAVGIGFAIFRGERVNFNLGLRGSYAFTDIVEDPNFYVLNDGVYQPDLTIENTSTNPFSLKLMLEINYFFGFWGDASCGRGRLMFFQ